MIYIIGVGGVGSWLASAMTKLVGPSRVKLVDGDKLEEKNLDRQLFTPGEIGLSKAVALSKRLGCGHLPEWYDSSLINHEAGDWLLCCADNDACRKQVLESVDLYDRVSAIIGANETFSSEAYVYLKAWRGTPHDPRVYYPEIKTNTSGDPMARGIGCTGEAQKENPQLVTANLMAASLMAHLFVVWAMEARKCSDEALPYLPRRLGQNLTRNTFVLGDKPKPKESHE